MFVQWKTNGAYELGQGSRVSFFKILAQVLFGPEFLLNSYKLVGLPVDRRIRQGNLMLANPELTRLPSGVDNPGTKILF